MENAKSTKDGAGKRLWQLRDARRSSRKTSAYRGMFVDIPANMRDDFDLDEFDLKEICVERLFKKILRFVKEFDRTKCSRV